MDDGGDDAAGDSDDDLMRRAPAAPHVLAAAAAAAAAVAKVSASRPSSPRATNRSAYRAARRIVARLRGHRPRRRPLHLHRRRDDGGQVQVHAFGERPAMAPWPFVVWPGRPTRRRRARWALPRASGRWVPLSPARDAYGNICTGGSALDVEPCEGGAADGGIEVHVVGGEGALKVEPTGEGRFGSSVVAASAPLQVAVTISRHLRGSPFEMQVNAGRTASAQTYAGPAGSTVGRRLVSRSTRTTSRATRRTGPSTASW